MWQFGYLELRDNNIRRDGAIELARSSHLVNLEYLGLGGNRIGPAGAMALAAAPHFVRTQIAVSVSRAMEASLQSTGRRFLFR